MCLSVREGAHAIHTRINDEINDFTLMCRYTLRCAGKGVKLVNVDVNQIGYKICFA